MVIWEAVPAVGRGVFVWQSGSGSVVCSFLCVSMFPCVFVFLCSFQGFRVSMCPCVSVCLCFLCELAAVLRRNVLKGYLFLILMVVRFGPQTLLLNKEINLEVGLFSGCNSAHLLKVCCKGGVRGPASACSFVVVVGGL